MAHSNLEIIQEPPKPSAAVVELAVFVEAKVLQDADRIDALGAIGLSRCLMLGGHMGSLLYNPNDPFCENRSTDDANFCVDHFFAKLLSLKDTMQTSAGKSLAKERTQFLIDFLDQLRAEIAPIS